MSTLRNDICNDIIDRFIDVFTKYPTATQEFKYSTREPMCQGMIDSLRGGEAAISLFEGNEVSTHKTYSTTTKELPITIEMYYKTKQTDRDWKTRAISGKLNDILADVIKIVLSDPQCSNKALNIEEISNRIDVDGIYDDTVGFEATFNVQYRHRLDDPTTRV